MCVFVCVCVCVCVFVCVCVCVCLCVCVCVWKGDDLEEGFLLILKKLDILHIFSKREQSMQ